MVEVIIPRVVRCYNKFKIAIKETLDHERILYILFSVFILYFENRICTIFLLTRTSIEIFKLSIRLKSWNIGKFR